MGKLHPIDKVWGYTYRLPPDGKTHYAVIRKGGKSSVHHHPRTVNGFFVIRGKLKILQKIGDDIILEEHDFKAVEAGHWHGFEALEDTELIETYGSDDDIIREREQT